MHILGLIGKKNKIRLIEHYARADYLLAWRVVTNISKYCSYLCYEFGFLFRALFSQLEKIFNSIEIPPHLPNI